MTDDTEEKYCAEFNAELRENETQFASGLDQLRKKHLAKLRVLLPRAKTQEGRETISRCIATLEDKTTTPG